MYAYYSKQDFLPTHARLKTVEDLAAYARTRAQFLNDKLFLPTRLFDGAHLIEFGPDTGENALAFSAWDAVCTLVEPNVKAHPVIREYFNRYGCRLGRIETDDIATYARRPISANYDFVIAEGFIYTVKPDTVWLNLFSKLLRPGGLAVISYYELCGGWIELFTKLIYTRAKSLSGLSGLDVAHKLFDAKWATIPHTRSFEQWHLDVLENPFVRLRYFLEAEELLRKAELSGLDLYSSWPVYRNGLEVGWHKRTLSPEERAHYRNEYLGRSRLSFLFGRPLFLRRPLETNAEALEVVAATDQLIDRWDTETADCVRDGLAWLAGSLVDDVVYATRSGQVRAMWEIISLGNLLDLLLLGDVERLAAFCQTDAHWLGLWGAPCQYAVLQKV